MDNLVDGLDVDKGATARISISSNLFILPTDILFKILLRAGSIGLIEGIGPNTMFVGIKCLLFVDNTLLFCMGVKGSILAIKALLLAFEGASNLRINFHKSLTIRMNLEDEEATSSANMVNCKKGVLPLTYLGLPLLDKKIFKNCWLPLLERIHSRLASWKGKMLC